LAIKINSGLGGLSELWPGVKVLAAHFFHGLLSGAIFLVDFNGSIKCKILIYLASAIQMQIMAIE